MCNGVCCIIKNVRLHMKLLLFITLTDMFYFCFTALPKNQHLNICISRSVAYSEELPPRNLNLLLSCLQHSLYAHYSVMWNTQIPNSQFNRRNDPREKKNRGTFPRQHFSPAGDL